MTELRALALCGPTASGKSEYASRLAAQCGGEIVNADSRQIYAGMRIGTGWPSDEQFARAPHHGYGIISPGERYNAQRFVSDARASIGAITARLKVPILVGGTGLYIEALAGSMPFDRPVASDELRARVRREAGTHPHEVLRAWLTAIAPDAAARISAGDRYRTLRALEAALASRDDADPSDLDRGAAAVRLQIIVLEADPAALQPRIVERVQAMFAGGLIEEALAVAARHPEAPALTGIGYAEALAYARGLANRDEATAATIRRTRAYAKRQQTWFRRLSGAVRLSAYDAATPTALRELAREFASPT